MSVVERGRAYVSGRFACLFLSALQCLESARLAISRSPVVGLLTEPNDS